MVCGAGCAGIELAFAFKERWQKEFHQDHIETTIVSSHDCVLPHEKEAARSEVIRKCKEKGIKVYYG